MKEKKVNNENSLSEVNQVVKSNAMIESMYHLNALEQKLVLSLCSKVKFTDDVFSTFEMSVFEFATFMGIDNKNFELNRILKKKCEELASRTLSINKGTVKKPNWYIFNWFHHIQYETGKGVISMQFHDDLVPYLLDIKNQYTKYRLGYVMNFKNEYSFRLYELMKEYEKIGERTLSISHLKQMLFIDKEEKYKKYSHFKARVINKALEEINKYSDLNVNIVKEEKEGRKVIGIVFEIRLNSCKYPIDEIQERLDLMKKTKEEIQKLLDNIFVLKYKINFNKVKTDLFVKEAILQLYIEIKNGEYDEKAIKYPIPYFTSILIKKHGMMTGESISKTQIAKYEMEQMMKEE